MHYIKVINFRILFAILVLCLIVACKHEPGKIIPTPPVAPLPDCDSTVIKFTTDVMPYVNSSCVVPGCHDNKGPAAGIDLSSYDAIMNATVRGVKIVKPGDPLNSKFCRVLFLLDLVPMAPPFNYQLSNKAKDNFVKWVQQGAKNNAPCVTRVDTTQFKYRTTIAPLINKYCTGCHFGNYNSGNVLLTRYSEVKAVVDSNKLYQVIANIDGFPKMPTGVVTMQPNEIVQIRKWIEDGAPNN